MLENILPQRVISALNALDNLRLYEVRLRDNCPVYVNLRGKNVKLLDKNNKEIILSYGECQKILTRATDFSLFSANNQIKNGFITVNGGYRIGVCGEVVVDGQAIKTIKNCSSLNVRVPHAVVGCAEKAYKLIKKDSCVYNTLIISPPGMGKTTILRDLARTISNSQINVLIVDERKEIAGFNGEAFSYDVGECSDVISNCSKLYAFSYALRSMAPSLIITDEIQSEDEAMAISLACNSGISVIASIHARSIEEFMKKSIASRLLGIERFLVLKGCGEPGVIEKVYNQSYEVCYGG